MVRHAETMALGIPTVWLPFPPHTNPGVWRLMVDGAPRCPSTFPTSKYRHELQLVVRAGIAMG